MLQQASALTPQPSLPTGPSLVGAMLENSPLPLSSPICRLLSGLLGLDRLCTLSRQVEGSRDAAELAERALAALRIDVDADFSRVPAEGPLVLVSNHPFGMLEGLVLMAGLGRMRPDLRILANSLLDRVADVDGLQALSLPILPVDVGGGRDAMGTSMASLRSALRHLGQGGAVVVFPSGTVSHWRRGRGICDPDWRSTALRLGERSGARIVPVFFEGRNSLPFSLAGLVHPGLRTLLLPRELINKQETRVRVRTGAPIDGDTLGVLPGHLRNRYLRMRCYALRESPAATARAGEMEPVAAPCPAADLLAALEALPAGSLLLRQDDYSLYTFRGSESPLLLDEIGRVREETFRPCGEGTGRARDLDGHDAGYRHLLLWNGKDRAIAGAYRLGHVRELLQTGGTGLYSARLFHLSQTFLRRFGERGLELGRALVAAPYQRDFLPLLLLWKGIAALVDRHDLRYLFGPASLSLEASPLSLRLITTMLASQYASSELRGLVRGRTSLHSPSCDEAEDAILTAIRKGDIDFRGVDRLVRAQDGGRGIPVLFRHYLQLNGSIAAFHCDRSFNTLDAFLFVDLSRAPASRLRRYMGEAAANAYLARHRSGCRKGAGPCPGI